MGETLFRVGVTLTMWITLPLVAVFLLLLWRYRKLIKPMRGYMRAQKLYGCQHRTNKKLNVTQMGDTQNYYLCEICGIKLKESDFNG